MRFHRNLPRSDVPTSAREHIERCERELLAAQDDAVNRLRAALRERPEAWEQVVDENVAFARTMAQSCAVLEQVRAGRPPLDQTKPAAPPAPDGTWHVQVSTLFLRESLAFLTEEFAAENGPGRERMHLVTGTITRDGVQVLSRIHAVPLAEQSAAYVKANPAETHFQIVELDEVHGHTLMSMFHSHPGCGADATRPSSTDRANQRRFDQLGIKAIAGICVKDGFFRFWTNDRPFELDVYGKGYRLVQDDPCMKVVELKPISERAA